MSFLLDALGKADDDRQRGHIPELVSPEEIKPTSSRQRLIKNLLISGLILLAFALGYFLRPFIDGDLTLQLHSNVQTSVAAKPAAAKQTLQAAAVSAAPAISRGSEALDLSVISYTDKPATRFVMINGVVMHEGDVLGTGERIVRIEEEGVLLEKNQQSLRLSLKEK